MLVSVVIPTLNEAESICGTIKAAGQTYAGSEVEIIVVDGGSTDGTLERVPTGVQILSAPRGRAFQMNAGARKSRGEVLVFCHADTCLPPGWRESVLDYLSKPGVSGGSFQIRLHPAKGFIHVLNLLWLPADWRILLGDQCQFMRRRIYEQVGGYPDIPIMEDLEMARALKEAGRLVRIPLRVTSSSRRFLERGPLRQFLQDVYLVVRYLYFGTSSDEIARVYRSSRESG